ncbi:hypothetical protein ACTVLL_11340 [Serratia nevei]|uniref:hypothetical protein n=1 Tax=Serratia nevei TaxID=2703794 RepID=UPI003FA78136
MSCGYQGYEFGAHYPDSICCDGYLWDADAYEDGMLTSGGDIPCPQCNCEAWMAYHRENIIEIGYEQGDAGEKPKLLMYGGYPEVIRADSRLMKKAWRWIKRGYYQGKKAAAQDKRASPN